MTSSPRTDTIDRPFLRTFADILHDGGDVPAKYIDPKNPGRLLYLAVLNPGEPDNLDKASCATLATGPNATLTQIVTTIITTVFNEKLETRDDVWGHTFVPLRPDDIQSAFTTQAITAHTSSFGAAYPDTRAAHVAEHGESLDVRVNDYFPLFGSCAGVDIECMLVSPSGKETQGVVTVAILACMSIPQDELLPTPADCDVANVAIG